MRIALIASSRRCSRSAPTPLPRPGGSPGELEYVGASVRGGIRGTFVTSDTPAGLDQALAAIPAQLTRSFRTICVKPGQFTDDTARISEFCHDLAARVAGLDSPARPSATG